MDNAIANEERTTYARCFVEVSAARQLLTQIALELEEGEIVPIPVENEWITPRCMNCVNFGYVETQCHAVKVWRQKGQLRTEQFLDVLIVEVLQEY